MGDWVVAGEEHPGGRRGWYYGWNIVGALIFMQMSVTGLTYNALSLFLKGWSRELQVPVSELTLAILALMLISSPVSPIAGALADKYPSRRLFTIGLLWMAAFFVAISFVARAWQIVALYMLCAPGLALCTTMSANTLIARWFVRRIGLALGLTTLGIGLGGVLLPPFLAALLPTVGWRMIWRAGGAIVAFVVVPLVLLIVRNQPTERHGFHYLTSDRVTGPARPRLHRSVGDGGIGWLEVMSRRNFWLLVFIYLSVMGTGSALHQNIAPFAVSRGVDIQTAALLLSVMGCSHLLAALGLGLLTDRFGCRLPLAGLAIAVATGLLILILVRDLRLVVFGVALIGFNTGVFVPLGAAISAEFGPHNFGKAFGLAMFFVPLSSPLAFILARTEEATGSYAPAIVVFMGMLVLATICSLLLKEAPRRQIQERTRLASSENY
jgi:MFS family permease